jgi:DNA-binding GntR family transcriptional regulator
MSVPDFIARPQLSEDVARFVRKRIFDGTYSAGEYVRLDQLAAELGISVTPVREALFELRAEGLLAQQPRRGFVVLPAVRLNHEFHRAINVAAESPKLAQLMSQITRYAPESVFPTIPGWPHQSIKDHRRVLAALAKHDSEVARKAMSEHLAAGAAPLINHLVEHGVVETT